MQENIYIRILSIKEHLGNITPEEKSILDAFLASSKEAQEIQKEIQAIPREELACLANDLDVEAGLTKVLEEESDFVARKSNPLIKWITASAAAAALLWAIFNYISPTHKTSAPKNDQLAHNIGKGQATLTLSNGQTINLNDSGYQQILAGNASVNNNNRLLKFDLPPDGMEGWNTLTVPTRLDYQIELSDGSTVWLNSTTKFRFPFSFSGKTREVFILSGEAYFKISPKPNQPFVVHTNQGDIQVLGTEFNINAYNNEQVVASLVNGKIAVKEGANRKELEPGYEATIEAKQNISVQKFDPSITLSWRQGLHYFNDAPITAVATMLERWFDTPLIIDNPKVAQRQFRGRIYRYKGLQTFIDQMNLTGDVLFYWKDGQLHCK
ncbi:FecR domain-containing protein [Chitinophaga niabensis]|uniref:FecR family protein n=1 Tax=Chitinophaga niabensis TaxID=536979 RepID=UPI0031BA8589